MHKCIGCSATATTFYEANKFKCHNFYLRKIIEDSTSADKSLRRLDKLRRLENELKKHNQLCKNCADREVNQYCNCIHIN